MNRITPFECERRWKILLQLGSSTTSTEIDSRRVGEALSAHHQQDRSDKKEDDGSVDDPYSCDDIVTPSSQQRAQQAMEDTLHKWKALNDRKVHRPEPSSRRVTFHIDNHQDSNDDKNTMDMDSKPPVTKKLKASQNANEPTSTPKNKKWDTADDDAPPFYGTPFGGGWRSSEKYALSLPENFDYGTQLKTPPPDDGSGDRVLDLLDPTNSLSYEQELWKLFASIPLVQDLKKEVLEGMHLPNTQSMHAEILMGLQEHPRMDGHHLSRLRSNHRHGFPQNVSSSSNNAAESSFTSLTDNVTTVRFEFMRQQVQRGSANSPYRAVLEFLATQTLWDVHQVLIALIDDRLWDRQYSHSRPSPNNDDNGHLHAKPEHSGFFFIEDTFYTAGDVDYVQPILQWIDEGGAPNSSRRDFLGIRTRDSLSVKLMKDMQLGDLAMRFNMRYHHCMHGDVETAVLFTDVQFGKKAIVPYPIVHDTFGQTYPVQDCDACHQFHAMYVTSAKCTVTDGPRALCTECCHKLKLLERDPNNVELLSIWKMQPDLSRGATCSTNF